MIEVLRQNAFDGWKEPLAWWNEGFGTKEGKVISEPCSGHYRSGLWRELYDNWVPDK